MSRAGHSGNRSVSPRRVRGTHQCYGKEAPPHRHADPGPSPHLPAGWLVGTRWIGPGRQVVLHPFEAMEETRRSSCVMSPVGTSSKSAQSFSTWRRSATPAGVDSTTGVDRRSLGVGPAADEAGSFQALDHPGHGGRVGIESRGEGRTP